ncbi:cytochrome P450 [Serinicoccus kebangsaanensis]|uniref:cytochrome P450 n=1 Tax=Serinicoccus kebangsaanensis TaxID=2602069 RepID=UPI00124C44B2|nr:cytochrome P450 [Serinicoccus kebangsaanensis]
MRTRQPARGGLPPGPRTPAALQTIQAFTDRRSTFERHRARYGDPFTVRMLPGPQHLVLFSDPDAIKEIFAGDPVELSGAQGNEMLRAAMGDRSVMLNDGEAHRAIRRYLMPAFSPAAVRAYRPVVERAAAAEIDTWTPGLPVVALERMSRVTLEVMMQVVLGASDPERLAALRPRVLRLVEVDPVVVGGWLYPRLRALPPWRGHARNLRAIDDLIHAEVTDRRRGSTAGSSDLLTQLLAVGSEADDREPLTADEIRDQVVTLLLAGYETTASTLAWTLHELGRDEQVRAHARRAAHAGDEEHLEACVKEATRLHPIIDYVARTLRSDQRIGGVDLPAGATAAPAILLAHHDPDAFPEPDRFRPERFLGEGPEPHTFIPFGGGVRRCIGAAFALMEGVVVLREVLTRVDVVADSPAPTRLRNITNVPGDGAPLRVCPPPG